MSRASLTLSLLAIAGAMALLLGICGIYGVIAYSVAQRRREIGIRMALGAQERQIRALFIRRGVIVAAAGLLFGLSCGGGVYAPHAVGALRNHAAGSSHFHRNAHRPCRGRIARDVCSRVPRDRGSIRLKR